MKSIMVVGLGSMGKRRIRLTQMLHSDIQLCGVDRQATRQQEVQAQFNIPCYPSITEALKAQHPNIGYVCTSPLSHHAVIMELLNEDLHVFTEINLLSTGYEEMVACAKAHHRVLFLSSTFLYRKDIRYMIDRIKGEKVNYIVHIGQYLPDWHPWENYKNFFVGDKRTNGCREIMAIDFPWLLSAFGKVTDVHVRSSKNSDLDLDYDDNYLLSFAHENGNKGVVVIDLLSRKAIRSALIFSDRLQLNWQGVPNSLTEYDIEQKCDRPIKTYDEVVDHQSSYAANIIENAYMDEIRTFFGMIDGTIEPRYTFEDDLDTLALIDRIEGKQ